MALTPLALPVASDPGRYDWSTRLVNCMAEERGPTGFVPFPLYAVDGLTAFSTLTSGGAVRGLVVAGTHLYAVSGRQVFKVDASGTATSVGGFASDGPVYMAVNQADPMQIMLVGEGVYGLIENDTILTISDADLQPPNSVISINQRFVTTTPSGRFQWSDILDGTSWPALGFATAEYRPDGLQRAFVRRSELLLFGDSTIEPWYAPGGGDDVFARAGTVIERGCLSGATLAMLEETPVFVGDDRTVRTLEGYQTRRISTHAVERSIRDTSDEAALTAFSYQKDGHALFVLSGADFTWIFDATTGQWHQRQSYGLTRWRAQHYAFFAGKHIVGDYDTNKLYEIDASAYDEDGADLVMQAQIPVHAFPRRVRLNELRINAVPGQGLNSSDDHDGDPQIMVKTSKDGGRTFGNERRASIGKRGVYGRQARFNRLGTSNEDGFVIDLSVSAAVAKGITAASADVEVLAR